MTKVNGHTAEQVIAAIKAAKGLISNAAEALGVSRTTVHRYINAYPTIKKALEDAREKQLDVTESKLYEAIDEKQGWAIALHLRTIGRHRGYVERQEVAGVDDQPLKIIVEYERDTAKATQPAPSPGDDQAGA